jgi:RNA polymerase sigma-70 factor, ECF subfamily
MRSDDAPADLTPSLVARLRAGDSGAGRMLDVAYAEPLRRFAAGYVGEADARDIVQDAFVGVLTAHAVPDDFRAYIYRVVRNRCLNALRARRRRRDGARLVTGFDVPARATGVLSKMGRVDDAARVAAAVRPHSPAQREAQTLSYGEAL